MSCDRFEAFELGRIDEDVFREHVKSCADCRAAVAEEKRLMERIQTLKEPVEAPWLWSRIEARLEQEKSSSRPFSLWDRIPPVLRFASVLALGMILGMVILRRPVVSGGDLLADAALRRVERREQAYESAIAFLEKKADRRMAGMDVELMFLYRDRLETIDAQIAECREALAENPANAHIRQYMLAALHDKKETLREIL